MKQIQTFIEVHSRRLLWLSIVIFVALFMAITTWKYFYFQYNALDLAIFNQVIHQTSQGHWFEFSIHPQNYLGDHLEPFLVIYAAFYRLFDHAVFLLFLQNALLGLSAWPLFRAAFLLTKSRSIALTTAGLWLLNPFVHDMATFEWHMFPLTIFFLFWALSFYVEKRFRPFIVFMLLALLTREDVALFTFMFGMLALIDRRRWFWVITPILGSVIYFFSALQIIDLFNPDNTYKFLYYYSWMEGNTVAEKLMFLLTHPWTLVLHLLHPSHFILLLGLFLPFAFLPLIKPRFLVLIIGPLSQLLLSSFFGSPIILQSHYSALLLPPLFLGTASALQFLDSDAVSARRLQMKLKKLFWWDKNLSYLVLLGVFLYAAVTWGSLFRGGWEIVRDWSKKELFRPVQASVVGLVPEGAPVAASFEFLPHLAERRGLYSLHYAFIGQRQYSTQKYELPDDVQWVVFNSEDIRIYEWQFSRSKIYQDNYPSGFARLSDFLNQQGFVLQGVLDSYTVWRRGGAAVLELNTTSTFVESYQQQQEIGRELVFDGWETFDPPLKPISFNQGKILPLTLSWHVTKPVENNYQFALRLVDKKGRILHEKIYPFAYGLQPTSYFREGEVVTTKWIFLTPEAAWDRAAEVRFQVLLPHEGYLGLNGYSTGEIMSDDIPIGEPIRIPKEDL